MPDEARHDANQPVLEISGLKKSFGPVCALDGVSFSLDAGERVAFLGPNGAGKTTLVRCLSGRTRPDQGEIRLLGQPIGNPETDRSFGLVPQEIALYDDLTARENLVAFAKFYGLRRRAARKRIDWALDWTGLAPRANDLVRSFSGGMQRRVNLACGVMHSPHVVLLDEPTAGVDPQSRQRIYSMLDQLSRDGTSILLTTHQLDEAQQQSDRIVILDGGRVVADGAINQLVEQSVGRERLVRLRIDRPLRKPVMVMCGETRQMFGEPGQNRIAARIDDVSTQLPRLLDSFHRDGYEVSDVEVQAPSLHHVFMHLTGHELRD